MRKAIRELYELFLATTKEEDVAERIWTLFYFYLITILAGLIVLWSTFAFIKKIVKLITAIWMPEVAEIIPE